MAYSTPTVDYDTNGNTPNVVAKQREFGSDLDPSCGNGDSARLLTVTGSEDLSRGEAVEYCPSRQNSRSRRAKPDEPSDELAFLSESLRIARIGAWWRGPTGPARWSEEMYRIYGVSPDTFVPTMRALLNLIHPEDRQAFQAWFEASLAGQQCHELEFRTILPDGSVRWINTHACRKEASGGTPTYIVGTAQDITERKCMEQNLSAALDYSRLLVDVCPVGVIVYKATGECISANEAAATIVGATVDQVKALNFWKLQSWKQSGLLDMAEQALATKSLSQIEVHINPSTFGKTSWLATRLAPFSFNSEEHLLAIFSDITERKVIEAQNKVYVEKLKTSLMQTVEVVTALSEMRDPYTAGHERRVAEIAVAIGAEMGFDAHRQQGLRVAGHLHDIGKINIPGEILSRPGKLSAAEFALVKEHSRAGHDVLKNVEFPWPVALVALQHHERIDGSGYPQGLKGDDIIPEARIIAVADVIEAMSSHRPYRPALGIEKALAVIERGRGTAFDAQCGGRLPAPVSRE